MRQKSAKQRKKPMRKKREKEEDKIDFDETETQHEQ